MEPQSPHLLRSAGEIRNRIYRLVLIECVITVTREEIGRRTALLKVCQTTRRESTSVFLKENRFQADVATDNYDHIITWLRLFERAQAEWINIAFRPVASAMEIKLARRPYATPPPATLTERTWHHLADYSIARQIMTIDLAHAVELSGVLVSPVTEAPGQPMWGSAACLRWSIDLSLRATDIAAGRQTTLYSMAEMCNRIETKLLRMLKRRDVTPATAAEIRRLLGVIEID